MFENESRKMFWTGFMIIGFSLITTTGILYYYHETSVNNEMLISDDEQTSENNIRNVEENKTEEEEEWSSQGSQSNEVIDQLNNQTTSNPNELELIASPPPLETRIDMNELGKKEGEIKVENTNNGSAEDELATF